VRTYRAYRFRGSDPAIAEVKDIIGTASLGAIDKAGGPAATTMRNWFKGKTKRPQNATLEAAGRAMGMKRVWVPTNGHNSRRK